jgi:hypothetical protein
MSAYDHISPEQFGFNTMDHDEWHDIVMGDHGDPTQRRIPVDSEIHTGQKGIVPIRVQEYQESRGQKSFMGSMQPVEVVEHQGRLVMGEGHHRLAAARENGQKTIRVHYFRSSR